MFGRTAFSSSATMIRTMAIRQGAQRTYSSNAAKEGGRTRKLFVPLFGCMVAGGVGLFALYKNNPTKYEPQPAIPTFTGDGKWIDLKLSSVSQVSPNTKLLRFELPSENHVSGLKVASALLTKYKGPSDEKPTIRPYTPTTGESERGFIELLVKQYPNGPMSTHLHSMDADQRLSFKGPVPKYEWTPNKHDHVALVAGGTGITPMYQIARAIFSNPEDKTKVTLVFGNVSEQDILLKKELEELENTYPQRFKAFYVLEKKPKDLVRATEGMITKELLKTVLPEPGKGNNKIFVCGPPAMYKAISGPKISPKDQGELDGVLRQLGYTKDEVYKF